MPYGITLVRSEPVKVTVWAFAAYRIAVEAADPLGFDGRVFVYERLPTDPYTQAVQDRFLDVAGPVEVADLPADAPDPGRGWPYFRARAVELDVRSTEQAAQVWDFIRTRVEVLLGALERLQELSVTEEVRVGEPGSVS